MYLNDSEEFIALIIAIGLVVGLLYKSYTDYHKMTREHNKKVIEKRKNEDLLFNGRMISTPIIGLIGLFSAPLILAANVSLDVKDRIAASDMSETCGGKAIDNTKIAQDVAINGSLGFLLQGTNVAVYPGGEEVPVSAAAEATRN